MGSTTEAEHAATESEVAEAPRSGVAAEAFPSAAMASPAARVLALQRAIGNRAVGQMLARSAPPAPPPPKIGPAKDIPEDRGDVERGYFSVTSKVTYGVRASGPGKEGGLWVDHLFETKEEADAYAQALAKTGAATIRETSALPVAWPGGKAGNPVTNVYVVEVPAGTPYIQGVVRAQPESATTPGLPASYAGGGPQTVLAKGNLIKHVSDFPVVQPTATPASSSTAATAATPATPPLVHRLSPAESTGSLAATLGPALRKESSDSADEARKLETQHRQAEAARKSKELEIKRLKQLHGDDYAVWEAEADLVGLKDAEKGAAAKRAAAEAKLAKAEADLKLLTEPGASTAALNDLLARRGSTATVGSTTEQSGHGWRFTESGWVKTDTTERSNLLGGAAVADKTTVSTTFDPLSGTTKTTTKSTTVTQGQQSASSTTTTSKGVSWAGGDLAYTSGTSTKTAESDAAKDYSKSTTKSESTTVGLSGITKTVEDKEQVGSTVSSTKTTTGLTRGDGKIGGAKTTVRTDGTVDESGKLTEGTQSTTKKEAGAIIGAEGIGGYAGASKEVKKQNAGGTYTSGSAGADCKFVVNVKELKDKTPVEYQLVLTISVGAKLGVGAGGEKESASKASASGSVSLSGSGSVTATFVHQLSEADKNAYLKNINAAAGGQADGSHREFGILATAFRSGPEAAKSALQGVKTAMGSAAGAQAMPEGSSVELGAEAKGEVGLTAGGKSSGGASVGIEAGKSKSGGIKVKVGKKGGKVVLTVEVSGEDAWKLGGTAGYGVASMGYTHEAKKAASQSVSFALTPGTPEYQQQFDEIRMATSIEQLKKLMTKYKSLLGAHTESSSEGSTGTTKMGVGPATFGITGGSERGKTVETDAEGKVTTTFTGSNVGGAELSVPGYKASTSTTEKLEVKVDPEGKATGDVTKTTTQSDLGKTLTSLPDKLTKDPLGVISGSAKIAESTTDVAGMRMSDADFDAIIARANDKRAWMKPVASPRLLADWEATRQAVLAANGDKKQIAQALTNFVGTDGHKRAAAIEGTVRRPLTGKGGTRYEWPDSLSKHKGAFDEIVFGDPLSSPQAKARAGQYKEAIDELNASIHKLAQVYGPLMGGASEFKDPAVHAEMISQINRVEGEMKAEVKIITNKMSRPAAAKADPKAAAAKPDPAAEEAERQKEAAERERLQAESWCSQVGYTFMNNKQREMQLFNEIDAEYNKKALGFIPVKADVIVLIGKINQIKEMHVQWHATIGQYKEKCAKYGWQPVLGGDREPNTAKKDEYYARINRW